MDAVIFDTLPIRHAKTLAVAAAFERCRETRQVAQSFKREEREANSAPDESGNPLRLTSTASAVATRPVKSTADSEGKLRKGAQARKRSCICGQCVDGEPPHSLLDSPTATRSAKVVVTLVDPSVIRRPPGNAVSSIARAQASTMCCTVRCSSEKNRSACLPDYTGEKRASHVVLRQSRPAAR
jgi:hypothetical protein